MGVATDLCDGYSFVFGSPYLDLLPDSPMILDRISDYESMQFSDPRCSNDSARRDCPHAA